MSCLSSLSGGPGVPVQSRVRLWPHPSAGLLTALSLTLFVVNCETLKPRPQVSYQETAYLCWGSSALMLWAGRAGPREQGADLGRAGGGAPARTRDRAGHRQSHRGFGLEGRGGAQGEARSPVAPPQPAGVLSYLNHMGVRSKRSLSFEMQAMYRQWVVRQSSSRNEYARQSGANL